MNDLTKIVLAAGFGLVSGVTGTLIGEPIKQRLVLRMKTKRIKEALLRELSRFRSTMIFIRIMLDDNRDEDPQKITKSMEEVFLNAIREAFVHYYSNEKEAFFIVENWESFVSTYRYLESVRQQYIENKKALGDAVDSCINVTDGELKRRGFESFKRGGYFDIEKMRRSIRVSSPASRS